jgi:NADH-quinone oxidoreductase subunit N
MTLHTLDFIALLPIISIAATAVVVLLAAAFYRRPGVAIFLTLSGLAISFALLPLAATAAPRQITPLLFVDGYALFYIGLVSAAMLAVALQCHDYFAGEESPPEEAYVLLLLAALGAATLVASNHFASFFLGLETLSIALFALIAYPAQLRHPLEAGIKYLVLAGASSAFLLFGMALIYASSGTLAFGQLGAVMAAAERPPGSVYLLGGLALIIAGIGFKLAVVPFHMWTPDVYEGAPAPVAALVATVSKGAVLALLLRLFVSADGYEHASLVLALSLIAGVSILAGNLLALLQDNIKRVLAYSSIAHLGYLLVAFLAAGALGAEAIAYYLVAYFITMLGAFGVVGVVSKPSGETDLLQDYSGLFWHRPWLAGVLTAMLLSLAGIPLTMGFVGKFYVVAAAIHSSLWLLVVLVVIGSAISLFYYLRIIAALYLPFSDVKEKRAQTPPSKPAVAGNVTLAMLTLLLVWLGVYPAPLIRVIQATAAHLT